jgi:hypothetical protein
MNTVRKITAKGDRGLRAALGMGAAYPTFVEKAIHKTRRFAKIIIVSLDKPDDTILPLCAKPLF